MAEHHELVAEMSNLEQMGTQERQKLAKKRRLQQLKKWGQREKEWIAKEKQLNKRLASMLHEENNGLNLKQYTTYSSSHRSKKKQQQQQPSTVNSNGKRSTTSNHNNNNNEFLNHNNNSLLTSLNGEATTGTRLVPHGRVHFNVGVMLLEAAARNDFEEVKRLLMLGVSPDSVNHDGLTALHQCCIDASEPMMNLLLEFGANVDARDTEQWTPLHAACTCGHLNLVKILVEHGANLLAVNGDGNMPFDICEDESTLDYIESQMVKRGITQDTIDRTRASTELQMLNDLEKQVEQGADLDAKNESGVTLLHVAAANGYLTVVEFLIKHGANVNACDNDQWRPLHGLACWGNEQHIKVAELLAEAGAQLDAKTANDETVFDLCDNVELLDRLNQLKDELANKQRDSSTDRLKRTQSRTNSRVHSVRRTSVRDKNQISRREAREEALLRVENSPVASGGGGGDKVVPVNSRSEEKGSQQQVQLDSSSERAAASETNNEAIHDSKPTTNGTNPQSLDHVDGPAHYQQTNIDDVVVDDDKQQQQHQNSQQQKDMTQNGRSQATSSNESISAQQQQQPPPVNKRKQFVKQAQVTHSVSSSNLSDSMQRPAVTGVITQKVTGSKSATRLNVSTDGGGGRLVNHQNTNDQIIIDAHQNNDMLPSTCDPSSNQLYQSNAIQLAPINYTLSNLKKQRSDLRMRTTSIGGGLNGQQVVLDPQPTSLQNGHNNNRPESPSSTFRKFRGEPSELIGAGGKSDRSRCCILI